MRREKIKELFRKTSVKAGAVAMAAVLVISGSIWVENQNRTPIPELVTFVDSEGSISITEEEVPLAAPKVTVSTKTTKKTKKIKLKKASKKTYSKKQSKKKTSTKKTSSSKETTTTQTVTDTKIVNKYKKGSRINTQVTTVKTTVTKTVVSKEAAGSQSSAAGTSGAQITQNAQANTNASGAASASPADLTIESAAPALDARVAKAYNTLGFKVTVNPQVSYSGLFDARTRMITLKKQGDTIYHEIGHFVAFLAGNVDKSAAFQQVFANEKSQYNEFNKGYVLSNSSEYFAESFKNYTLNATALQASRPQTYAAIQAALNALTDAHVARVASVYSAVWK